jgi:hypothetical protein
MVMFMIEIFDKQLGKLIKWKINFALYFPIDTANIGSDRRSCMTYWQKQLKVEKLLKCIQIVISIQKII